MKKRFLPINPHRKKKYKKRKYEVSEIFEICDFNFKFNKNVVFDDLTVFLGRRVSFFGSEIYMFFNFLKDILQKEIVEFDPKYGIITITKKKELYL